MDIITNWIPRNMVALYELDDKQRAWFDYVEDDAYTPRFVQYRGEWVDVFDTQCIEADNGRRSPVGWGVKVHPGSPMCLFDSVTSDSYFSGLLFRLVDDDKVVVARYMS
jgi:hypothetical protein